MEILQLENISKNFGGSRVLDNISLSVNEDEIFFILGPSGCGKTTLLRIITGFVSPDSGKVILNGKNITGVAPAKRNIGLVFQNYALWPHLTVYRNVSYGLEIKKFPPELIAGKTEEILKITKLLDFKNHFPTQLSGGQQQRTALARAIVNEPKILLLDEPLSNLDAKLREEMREEIRRVQKATGITMIYVTHDQKEAMVIGKRIAIMDRGKEVQTGSPFELYTQPVNKFAASFLGELNSMAAVVKEADETLAWLATDEGDFRLSGKCLEAGQRGELCFRPEGISLAATGQENVIQGTVRDVEYLGEMIKVVITTTKNHMLHMRLFAVEMNNIKAGEKIAVHVAADNLMFFPSET